MLLDIAATAYGRDFLMKHQQSEQLINTFIKVLAQEPCIKFATMKKLVTVFSRQSQHKVIYI